MTAETRVTLEQWRALIAVVEAGSFAAGAERLHRTQSTVSHAVNKLQRNLGLEVFVQEGRRAVLTPVGRNLYRRALALVEEAGRLEHAARDMARGWEAGIRLAVEIIFPTWLLLQCLARFAEQRPDTPLELHESVLGGTSELLLEGRVDLAIASQVPQGFLGDPLTRIRFIAAAAPQHPLHQLGRLISQADLRRHRRLLVRDSGSRRDPGIAWDATGSRWTVSHKATSIRAATMGLGYAWYAEGMIREELLCGRLKPLPLEQGAQRYAELYLVYADPESAGPGTRRLAALLRDAVSVINGASPEERHR